MSAEDQGSTKVVGVGASAGGLGALKRLFAATSADIGAAFVVVQHRDPTHESLLASLIDRVTGLRVVEATHGVRLAPGTVYTAPPGRQVWVNDGMILLQDPPQARHQNAPIDHLFRSIAESCDSSAIGIVLTGTGSDGTQGLRDIKSAGGVALVQEPSDAEFDGMPTSAIETGLVDVVADVEELAERLEGILHPPGPVMAVCDGSTVEPDGLDALLRQLHKATGYDFRDYKRGTLVRRIRRRMGINRIKDIDAYTALLTADDEEPRALVKDLLIGVTRFFRDPQAWEDFAHHAIDPTLERLSDGDVLRAWAAGCATGEEAYTLAISILERVEHASKAVDVQVFATDLNPSSLDRARAGRYQASSLTDVAPSRVERWFVKDGDQVRVVPQLRERLVFAAQNAVTDPPFSSLDLVSCRNLLIYLDGAAQKRLIETFHFALKPDGFLMLGVSETADRAEALFETVVTRNRIYRRLAGEARRLPSPMSVGSSTERTRTPAPSRDLGADAAVRAMLSRFVPPAALLGEDFELVSLHGELGKYLGFRRGTMSSSFLTLVADTYQSQVWTALQTARRQNAPAEAVVFPAAAGEPKVNILAEPITVSGRRRYLVYFREEDGTGEGTSSPVDGDRNRDDVLEVYQNELTALRQEMQEVIERSETSKEELQAAHEEVMSANEELQSSNEELETSREELESLNQELSSINAELEDKIAELEATNDDLANLISSTDIATIFLDTDLCIRRFSARTADLLRIREADIGRPLDDLALKVDDPELIDDVRRSLERLQSIEVQVEGKRYAFIRRVTPFRTRTGHIQGVTITYSDVSRLRDAVTKLALQAQRQNSIVELGELALGSEDVEALFERAASELKEWLAADIIGIHELVDGKSDFDLVAGAGWARGLVGRTAVPNDVRNELGLSLHRPGPLVVADVNKDSRITPSQILKDADVVAGCCVTVGPIVEPWGVLSAWWRRSTVPDEEAINYLTSVASILWLAVSQSETKRLREGERRELQALIDGVPVLIGVVNETMRFEIFNRAFEALGWTSDEMRGAPVADVLGAEAADAARALMARPDAGDTGGVEIDVQVPGEGPRTHLLYCVPRRKAGKHADGFFLAALDINERKRWEERNRVISAELDHRVKNILALVNSIARMTGRNATSFEEFRAVFSDRIDSLARTHAKLAAKSWEGTELRSVIEDELAAYATGNLDGYTLAGPTVALTMRATQSLALAIHELTTNAAKYGALSRPDGRLDVSWQLDGDTVAIDWKEGGLSGIGKPNGKGFGSALVENAIVRQLDGRLTTDYLATGLVCRISIPIQNLSAGAAREPQ